MGKSGTSFIKQWIPVCREKYGIDFRINHHLKEETLSIILELIAYRFLRRVRISDKCWEWTGSKNRFGYGKSVLIPIESTAHRVSYRIFNGDIPKGSCVMHICDNPGCVKPEHLKLGTHEQNWKDRVIKGRTATGINHGSRKHPEKIRRGIRHHRAKLTEEDVREILTKKQFESGVSLAKKFNVSVNTISRIKLRNGWKHIQ